MRCCSSVAATFVQHAMLQQCCCNFCATFVLHVRTLSDNYIMVIARKLFKQSYQKKEIKNYTRIFNSVEINELACNFHFQSVWMHPDILFLLFTNVK